MKKSFWIGYVALLVLSVATAHCQTKTQGSPVESDNLKHVDHLEMENLTLKLNGLSQALHDQQAQLQNDAQTQAAPLLSQRKELIARIEQENSGCKWHDRKAQADTSRLLCGKELEDQEKRDRPAPPAAPPQKPVAPPPAAK